MGNAPEPSLDAITATRRFGLGGDPAEVHVAGADPRGWLHAQLASPDAALIRCALPSAAEAIHAVVTSFRQGRAPQPPAYERYRNEVGLRFQRALETDAPFLERLVMFWSNHFAVSAEASNATRVSAGAYEREAIRPFILGRFRDMLGACISHPAMLLSLDNSQSTGPDSAVGRRRNLGVNENLARELLELHTLGSTGGYSQSDVRNVAYALSGWRVDYSGAPSTGRFEFDLHRHQPGPVEVLGRICADLGQAQAECVLDHLATHRKTAAHLSRKFAHHFLGDAASDEVVSGLTLTFRETDGNLRALTAKLIDSDEAWSAPPAKLLPPYDFIVSVCRAAGWRPDSGVIFDAMRYLGQPVWEPPAPAGWPAQDSAWAAPDSLVERVDWAEGVAAPHVRADDAVALGEAVLGARFDSHTRQAIARSGDRRQALALLFCSAAFQRR